MADERTCYAGDLTSDAIGKKVTLRVEAPLGSATVETTVTDQVREIRHRKVQGKTVTVLHFESASTGSSRHEGGYALPHTQVVEVHP